jgi:hypothetical protein
MRGNDTKIQRHRGWGWGWVALCFVSKLDFQWTLWTPALQGSWPQIPNNPSFILPAAEMFEIHALAAVLQVYGVWLLIAFVAWPLLLRCLWALHPRLGAGAEATARRLRITFWSTAAVVKHTLVDLVALAQVWFAIAWHVAVICVARMRYAVMSRGLLCCLRCVGCTMRSVSRLRKCCAVKAPPVPTGKHKLLLHRKPLPVRTKVESPPPAAFIEPLPTDECRKDDGVLPCKDLSVAYAAAANPSEATVPAEPAEPAEPTETASGDAPSCGETSSMEPFWTTTAST